MLSRRGASRPGRLRGRLVLQKDQMQSDGHGGAVRSWQDVIVLAADIRPARGRERIRGEGLIDSVSHEIIIRWRGDVKAGDRFVDELRTFNIRAVSDPDEDRRYLICQCEEAAP